MTSRSAGRLCGERSTRASGGVVESNASGTIEVFCECGRVRCADRLRIELAGLRRGARSGGAFRRHHPPRPRCHPAPGQPAPRVSRRREGAPQTGCKRVSWLRTFPAGVCVANSCAIWNQVGNADVADAPRLTCCGSSQRRLPWRSRCKSAHSLTPGVGGWPIKVTGTRTPDTAQAIKDFQRGYLGDPPVTALREDGLVGPKTEEALRSSAANGGRCSKNFMFREFASSKSGWIRTHRELVFGLEKLRDHVGHPIGILSGFRDFDLGASMSQHKFGNAIDPTKPLPHFSEVAALKVFSGIGHFATDGSRPPRRRPPRRPEPHRRYEGQADDLRRRVLSGNNRAGLCVYISDGCGRSSSVSRR